MRELDVGVDLDGVLVPWEVNLANYLILHMGYSAEEVGKPWSRYDQWRDWGLTTEDFLRICGEATDMGFMFLDEDPYPGAVQTIQNIKSAGHRIHVITARSFGTRSAHNTVDWLTKHDVPYDSLVMTSTKGLCQPDVMIDDYEHNFHEMWKHGVETWLLSQPWNSHIDTEFRVNSLQDFERVIERKANQ